MHNRTEKVNDLYNAILSLKTEDECYDFFDDLCSPKEIEQMSERFASAKMLTNGETYDSVIKKTSISSATLSRVSKCIKNGSGYKTIIERQTKEKSSK